METSRDLAPLKEFACNLADAAGAVTLARWRAFGGVEDKGGAVFDPVTEADRAAERAMRALIEYRYPNHGIIGEEFADRPARGRYSWSLDPIDGTRSFICGLPTWTTLIALLDEGEPVLGLVDAPRLGERYIGAGTATVTCGDVSRPIAVSDCARLADARLSATDPAMFQGAEADGFARVRAAARVTRYGHDGYAYARLADGSIDLVIESGLKPHDWRPLIPLIRAAGGVIGDWEGGDDLSGGRLVAAATQSLFEATVALLKG